MKKSLLILLAVCISIISYSQMDRSGMTFGFQFSKNYMKNAYFSQTFDANNVATITQEYNDRFNFNHFDMRVYSVGSGMVLSCDGSSVPDLIYILGLIIADKNADFTGKLRKVEDNLGPEASGYAANWSYVQCGFAFGGETLYMGLDVDLGSIGVSSLQNSGGKAINGSWYLGVGGIANIVTEPVRGTLRVDKLFSGNQIGLAIMADADYALGEYFYVGAFFKKFRINKYHKSIEDPNLPVNKHAVNSFGIRLGAWLPL